MGITLETTTNFDEGKPKYQFRLMNFRSRLTCQRNLTLHPRSDSTCLPMQTDESLADIPPDETLDIPITKTHRSDAFFAVPKRDRRQDTQSSEGQRTRWRTLRRANQNGKPVSHVPILLFRQSPAELLADVGLNFADTERPVRLDDQFLSGEKIQNRFGLRAIVAKALAYSFLVIVAANDEVTTAHVASIGLRGTVMDQVVVQSALAAESPCKDPFKHDFVRDSNMNHRINVIAFKKELGLSSRAGKAVENKAKVPVVLGQSFPNDLLDRFVVNHFPFGNQPLDPCTEFRMRLNVPAKDVSNGDVHNVKLLFQQDRLCSFTTALSPHDDVLVHNDSDKVDGGITKGVE